MTMWQRSLSEFVRDTLQHYLKASTGLCVVLALLVAAPASAHIPEDCSSRLDQWGKFLTYTGEAMLEMDLDREHAEWLDMYGADPDWQAIAHKAEYLIANLMSLPSFMESSNRLAYQLMKCVHPSLPDLE